MHLRLALVHLMSWIVPAIKFHQVTHLEYCNLGLTKVHHDRNVSDAQTRLLKSTLSTQSIISLWFQKSMNTVPQWKKIAFPVVTVLCPSMLFELLLLSKQSYRIFYCILFLNPKWNIIQISKLKSRNVFETVAGMLQKIVFQRTKLIEDNAIQWHLHFVLYHLFLSSRFKSMKRDF